MTRLQWIFHGQVQGVGFRATAQSIAQQHGIKGWIKNRDDGTVEMEAEASDESLQTFLKTIQEEPNPFIKVRTIDEQTYHNEKGHKKFKIAY
ncbi:acylphosphatase [Halobacillus seohaensis]|uniref:acylphosphatase n=1 Tax=Halobacillus seohaensis TaxID=447421 RepID=A0ABW2EHD0_9BACI